MSKGKAKRRAADREAELAPRKTQERKEFNIQVHKKKTILSILPEQIKITAKTPNQQLFMDQIHTNGAEIVIGAGVAGCGKTFIALVESLNLLRDQTNKFTEIVLYKSVTQLKGEETGYLPGDLKDKMHFINMSFFLQFEKLLKQETIKKLLDEGFVKILPVGSIRGASMSEEKIIIVDEFQNLSVDNGHAVVTRMEEKSKLIIIGDVTQRDRGNELDNALRFVSTYYKGVDDKIQITEFTHDDVVRNELIKKLQKIYEDHAPSMKARRVVL